MGSEAGCDRVEAGIRRRGGARDPDSRGSVHHCQHRQGCRGTAGPRSGKRSPHWLCGGRINMPADLEGSIPQRESRKLAQKAAWGNLIGDAIGKASTRARFASPVRRNKSARGSPSPFDRHLSKRFGGCGGRLTPGRERFGPPMVCLMNSNAKVAYSVRSKVGASRLSIPAGDLGAPPPVVTAVQLLGQVTRPAIKIPQPPAKACYMGMCSRPRNIHLRVFPGDSSVTPAASATPLQRKKSLLSRRSRPRCATVVAEYYNK